MKEIIMSDELLFNQYDLRQTIENHSHKINSEIDNIPDERLLATDMDELTSFVYDKWAIELPELGEPLVSSKRIKIEVGRYGQGYGYDRRSGVMVDAEEYTIEIPFSGDKDLFFHQGSTFSTGSPCEYCYPSIGDILSHTLVLRET